MLLLHHAGLRDEGHAAGEKVWPGIGHAEGLQRLVLGEEGERAPQRSWQFGVEMQTRG